MHFQWTFSTWKEETTKNNARDNERFHAPGMNRARDSPNTIKIGPFNHWTRGSRVRFTQSQFVEKNKQNGGSKVSDADWLYFSFHDPRWFFWLIRVPFYFIFIFFIPSWLVWVDLSWSDPDWRSELIRSDFCTCLDKTGSNLVQTWFKTWFKTGSKTGSNLMCGPPTNHRSCCITWLGL